MKYKYVIAMMETAEAWAKTSEAQRLQVGAVIAQEDTIIAQGVNGTYKGLPNVCEGEDGLTLPHVRHAEAAALDKLVRSTSSAELATMYVTHAPCLQCSYRIVDSGIAKVYYKHEYRDTQGVEYLRRSGVIVERLEDV